MVILWVPLFPEKVIIYNNVFKLSLLEELRVRDLPRSWPSKVIIANKMSGVLIDLKHVLVTVSVRDQSKTRETKRERVCVCVRWVESEVSKRDIKNTWIRIQGDQRVKRTRNQNEKREYERVGSLKIYSTEFVQWIKIRKSFRMQSTRWHKQSKWTMTQFNGHNETTRPKIDGKK